MNLVKTLSQQENVTIEMLVHLINVPEESDFISAETCSIAQGALNRTPTLKKRSIQGLIQGHQGIPLPKDPRFSTKHNQYGTYQVLS